MPSHIYIRVGDYHEASAANLRAIEADEKHMMQVERHGEYKLAYVPHNYHFLWATATFEGRSEMAINSAREMANLVDTSLMRTRGLTTLQHYWITPLYALVRFGKWDEILAWQEPADDLIYPRAVWHYARGMAMTRKQDFEAADSELASLDQLRDDESLKWVTVWDINKSRHILAIAYYALAGELEFSRGNHENGIKRMIEAVALEDSLNYDEPPTWHYPTRQSLAALYLESGNYELAEETYLEDLKRFPNNGWSLYGLLETLRMQGKDALAAEVQKRFYESWLFADVILTSSRY
jgi:hypothetical protein